MSDSNHKLMSHSFSSSSNKPKPSYQPTGIIHCSVAYNSTSAARSSGLPAYAVVDWSEGRERKEATRSANPPAYAKQCCRCINDLQDKPGKNHAKSEDIMCTPLRKEGRNAPPGNISKKKCRLTKLAGVSLVRGARCNRCARQPHVRIPAGRFLLDVLDECSTTVR